MLIFIVLTMNLLFLMKIKFLFNIVVISYKFISRLNKRMSRLSKRYSRLSKRNSRTLTPSKSINNKNLIKLNGRIVRLVLSLTFMISINTS